MSIATALTALADDVSAAKAAITAKGGTAPIGTADMADAIAAIPSGGITPTGKITITENGTDIDVAQYALADVNVSGGGTPQPWDTVKHDLPAEYTEMLYLESSGTQYIDMDFVPTVKPKIECWCNVIAGDHDLFGTSSAYFNVDISQDGSTTYKHYYRYGSNTSNIFNIPSTFNSSQHWEYYSFSDKIVQHRRISDNLFYAKNAGSDRETATVSNVWDFSTNTRKVYMFKGRDYHTAALGVVYAYDGEILKRFFVPAMRNSDSVLGMYDKVSNTFFTNAGTGEFIGGTFE